VLDQVTAHRCSLGPAGKKPSMKAWQILAQRP